MNSIAENGAVLAYACTHDPTNAAPWLLVLSSEEVPDAVMDMMIDAR